MLKKNQEALVEYDIKVIVEKDKAQVSELVESFNISDYIDENGCLILKKLILTLKNQYNMPMENKQIQFYLAEPEIYMNCGLDPINEDIKIRPENFQLNNILTIKARDLGISLVHRLMSFDAGTATNEEKQRIGADEIAEKSKCRRTKERRIGHIIDKVIDWRKFYAGTLNEKNQQIKYSLEEAAKQVAISKKSLDDYLFQIRYGYRYGFNFNEHYNDKVGVLRDFVRQNKKNDKNQIKQKKQKGQTH